MDSPLRIFLITANSARRLLLTRMAGSMRRPKIISSASGISPDRIMQAAPDVVVIDVHSRAVADAAIRLLEESPHQHGAVILIDDPEPRWITQALRAGANGILSREVTADDLELAILAAEAGMVLMHPASVQQLRYDNSVPIENLAAEQLTLREQEILRLLSDGLGNKEIAGRLGISDHTVKFHVSSILGKLGAASRTEAVSQGIKRGLIPI